MSQKACPQCGNLFKGGDKIKAVVLAEWQDLKSSACYAITRPTECIEVTHRNCQMPQGELDGD
jgi:hypothetical protein